MTTFILDVLEDLKKQDRNLSELIFILPSKRAGIFLKNQISQVVNHTIIAPQIISIEEFVEDLSQLKKTSNTELLFVFYKVYLELTKKEDQESFDSFSKWAQILLQDFNEVDRYLIPQEKIFNYLSAIQDLKHWSLEEPKTEFVKKYLAFWNKLNTYYTKFTEELLKNKTAYQGLIYREAVENIESYIQSNKEKQHIFLGFNALNKAEENIIQELLQNELAEIYWDVDKHFFDNPIHDAGLFTRQHFKNWNFFRDNDFNWKTNHYSEEKNIKVFGVPKNIGQAKFIGGLLKDLQKEDTDLKQTAVILADENLLTPTLNALPESIDALNITMGFPLQSIPLASLFEQIFQIHKKANNTFYYKDVIAIISHQFIRPLFRKENTDVASKITNTILTNNLVYISIDRLKELAPASSEILDTLFVLKENRVKSMLKNCSNLILSIKKDLDKNKALNKLSLEYLFRFNELFNELTRLNTSYNYIQDMHTLHSIYKELLSSATLDFQGEPLQGLQVMGMLESRVLDFETVIISSVNEGVLPSGKTNNSFIPFDVKLQNKLPTYKEKDAVYTYHFYRLLQRAKNVYILYNTEADILTGGEKSRFITQLELEGVHKIKHSIVTPKVEACFSELIEIEKTVAVLNKIQAIAERGFSPSSLTNYMRNPIDFYYQKVLGIAEQEDVEESVAFNTLGTVVHNTLEDLYEDFVGEVLTVEKLKSQKSKITERITHHFINEYKEGDITTGKNLIIYEIAKRYVLNFINLEIDDVQKGNEIKIIALEDKSIATLKIPELDFDIKLTGKVDRVDSYNGTTRIIDYKTGKVEKNQVEIADWEAITTDYKKYSKSFQVLLYAYMMHQENKIEFPLEAGIISFKNLKAGFLKFAAKEEKKKNTFITQETLDNFEIELKKIILEICNLEINFIEKEV
ncbi:PD-(D/E)XK nuclease family protein [Oceanihabitans sediminis]|uniref:PD-(D/E)XK nuclease family protein n=1 Tax=Oceanihabitans sediminis TaxID=1812012 RepID=UPI00299EA649|nr:PD-(D/E)XK nuclease family protein [Oceanihabitans sediminis]MDX1277320.1 PD-(D/E)XK nuclease family protein [Oceanihabitans sediminis]MDX1773070.1 PD-(D/E)XK nuclease family protein [Oceanihabitans sediminis]